MNTQLLEQLSKLEWLMHRSYQHNMRRRGPGDPHRGQGRILALLQVKPQISQKELSFLLDMRPQSLGELLGKLERGGYIERTPSQEDRRVMEIRLTQAGSQAAVQPEEEEDLFACLTEQEQNALSGYLARVIEALEQRCPAEPRRDGRGHHGDEQEGRHGGRGGECRRGHMHDPHGSDSHEHGPHGCDSHEHGPHSRDSHEHGPHGCDSHDHGKQPDDHAER